MLCISLSSGHHWSSQGLEAWLKGTQWWWWVWTQAVTTFPTLIVPLVLGFEPTTFRYRAAFSNLSWPPPLSELKSKDIEFSGLLCCGHSCQQLRVEFHVPAPWNEQDWWRPTKSPMSLIGTAAPHVVSEPPECFTCYGFSSNTCAHKLQAGQRLLIMWFTFLFSVMRTEEDRASHPPPRDSNIGFTDSKPVIGLHTKITAALTRE